MTAEILDSSIFQVIVVGGGIGHYCFRPRGS